MKANTIRKQLETHPDDKNLQCMLDSVEDDIPIFVDYYKDVKVLPRRWKYDPATASTLVPKKSLILTDIDFISSDSPKRHGFSPPPYDLLDTNRKHPNTEVVPLNADEEKIWPQFLEFTKKTPRLVSISLRDSCIEKEKRTVPLDNPIVGLIGNFAVDTFNQAFEMLIKEGEHNRIHFPEFKECRYIKMTGYYYFYLTLMACEEGLPGIYETKVECTSISGERTLSHFVSTYPKSEYSCSDSEDDWSDPEEKITIRGMELRRKDATCRGYDYYTPFGFDGP